MVKYCWHFSTDGNKVDAIFKSDDDFRHGMNMIFVLWKKYSILILAFCLMDNHLHFILYGDFNDCNKFVHEYIKRISMRISKLHGTRHTLRYVPVDYQAITDQNYLKAAIVYTIKNPTVAGKSFLATDYPWSSGSLYFRSRDYWTVAERSTNGVEFNSRLRQLLGTRDYSQLNDAKFIQETVFPGYYVECHLVERVFKTVKSFHFMFCKTKDDDIEARGGLISRLSLSDQEARQHKAECCLELFGNPSTRSMTIGQRLKVARMLKRRYQCSAKQVARICHLVYDEVKDLI